MDVHITCNYCDEKWGLTIKSKNIAPCKVCNSKDLKVVELDKLKVDYYVGCLPFAKPQPIEPTPQEMDLLDPENYFL